MFIDELCHDLVGSQRRALVPMSRRTSAGDEARLYNDPYIPLHLPERVEEATRSNRCIVCSEKYKQSKRVNPAAKDKDLSKLAKTGANPVKCFCASLLAMKTVSNYITRKYSFGARLVNAGSRRPNFETACYIVIEIKKTFHKHV